MEIQPNSTYPLRSLLALNETDCVEWETDGLEDNGYRTILSTWLRSQALLSQVFEQTTAGRKIASLLGVSTDNTGEGIYGHRGLGRCPGQVQALCQDTMNQPSYATPTSMSYREAQECRKRLKAL